MFYGIKGDEPIIEAEEIGVGAANKEGTGGIFKDSTALLNKKKKLGSAKEGSIGRAGKTIPTGLIRKHQKPGIV